MTDLINLFAESGRNIIGDDATPTLELDNSSTGSSLKLKGVTDTNPILELVNRNVSGVPTVAMMKFSTSAASQAAFQFAGSCIVSTASGGVSLVAKVRVKFGDLYGWMPIYEVMA